MIEYSKARNDPDALARPKRMLDWLVSIQFPEGGFQGSVIGTLPDVPVTFNTGQILLGLASGTLEFGDGYRPAIRRAAEWLVNTQGAGGAGGKFPFALTEATDKAYETHFRGAFEAARREPEAVTAEAAQKRMRPWAAGGQRLVRDSCLSDRHRPLTLRSAMFCGYYSG